VRKFEWDLTTAEKQLDNIFDDIDQHIESIGDGVSFTVIDMVAQEEQIELVKKQMRDVAAYQKDIRDAAEQQALED
jgi:hypothetical protein